MGAETAFTFKEHLKAYKLQIIWMSVFVILQVFLFGMGILEYFEHLKHNGRDFSTASMLGLATGMCLNVDCAILILFPAFRMATGFLHSTRLNKVFPFDALTSFHIVLGFTMFGLAIVHTICFVFTFCKNKFGYHQIGNKSRSYYLRERVI